MRCCVGSACPSKPHDYLCTPLNFPHRVQSAFVPLCLHLISTCPWLPTPALTVPHLLLCLLSPNTPRSTYHLPAHAAPSSIPFLPAIVRQYSQSCISTLTGNVDNSGLSTPLHSYCMIRLVPMAVIFVGNDTKLRLLTTSLNTSAVSKWYDRLLYVSLFPGKQRKTKAIIFNPLHRLNSTMTQSVTFINKYLTLNKRPLRNFIDISCQMLLLVNSNWLLNYK